MISMNSLAALSVATVQAARFLAVAFALGLLEVGTANADKYGIDEATAENGGSWGAVLLVLLVLAYLYFKEK